MRRLVLALLLASVGLTATVSLSGCSSLLPHSLQPQQLWKLNRQAPASGGDF